MLPGSDELRFSSTNGSGCTGTMQPTGGLSVRASHWMNSRRSLTYPVSSGGGLPGAAHTITTC